MLDHSNDVHAIDDLAKHDMFVVQEGRRGGRDKELTAIGVWAGVLVQRFSRSSNGKKNRLLACRVYSTRVNMTYRHTQKTWAVMWQRKILICKLGGAVNGAAACAVAIYEIATLNHEILDLREVSRKSLALSIEMGGGSGSIPHGETCYLCSLEVALWGSCSRPCRTAGNYLPSWE